jgi:dTDP-4-dehydrorhamnose 3,5-epimerase
MNIIDTEIPDVKIIVPQLFEDERGAFEETYNKKQFDAVINQDINFVQDNQSRSMKRVLRGLHYQVAPMQQAKLIRVTQGEIFDVAVDMRQTSPTFGRWISTKLSAANRFQLWLPAGFAHGFYVESDYADCAYKTTQYYSASHERCIVWNDPHLAIAWPLTGAPILSPKDSSAASFSAVFPLYTRIPIG